MMSKVSTWMQGQWRQIYGWELQDETSKSDFPDSLWALGTISKTSGALRNVAAVCNNESIPLCHSVCLTVFCCRSYTIFDTEYGALFKDPSAHSVVVFGPLTLAEASALEMT